MPAKVFLNQAQKERSQTVVRSKDCPKWREHPMLLVLQNDGKTCVEIADFFRLVSS